MSYSTVREYVVLLRRLDELLTEAQNPVTEVTIEKIQDQM